MFNTWEQFEIDSDTLTGVRRSPRCASHAGSTEFLCLREIARLTQGRLSMGSLPPLGGDLEPVGRIVTDLLEVSDGDVFWSLPGADGGGEFVEAAFARGALGVVVSRRRIEPWAGKFVLEVDDSERALFAVATWARRHFAGLAVLVVESPGRTEFADGIERVLRTGDWFVSRTPAARDLRGLAASICSWPEKTGCVLVEFDQASAGEVAPAVQASLPEIAVIAGTQEMKSRTAAKWELRQERLAAAVAATAPDGWLVVDGDDPAIAQLTRHRKCRLMRVGRDPHCDVRAEDVRAARGSISFRIRGQWYAVPGTRSSRLQAALTAVAVGRIAGLNDDKIAAGLSSRPEGRLEPQLTEHAA